MSRHLVRNPRWVSLVLALFVLTSAAPAAEIGKFLPEDTEVVIALNVKQILGSPLVKQFGLDQAKAALGQIEEVGTILKDLGFDPFTDLHSVLITSPGGNDQDKGLIIINGKFDLDKFKAKADDAVKTQGDVLKVHKVTSGKNVFQLYEVMLPDSPPLFVSLASKTTILASPGKDYVVDALKKDAEETKTALKSKEFQALLEKIDGNQSLYIAGLGSALAKGNAPEGAIKDALAKIDAIGGGITITKDIDLEFVIGTKTLKEAKELNKEINDGLTKGIAGLAFLALNDKKFATALDIVRSVRCTSKDKAVTVKAQLTEEALKKLIQPEQ